MENLDYSSIDNYYNKNEILSNKNYIHILRSGISRVSVFKREPSEKMD